MGSRVSGTSRTSLTPRRRRAPLLDDTPFKVHFRPHIRDWIIIVPQTRTGIEMITGIKIRPVGPIAVTLKNGPLIKPGDDRSLRGLTGEHLAGLAPGDVNGIRVHPDLDLTGIYGGFLIGRQRGVGSGAFLFAFLDS